MQNLRLCLDGLNETKIFLFAHLCYKIDHSEEETML